MNNIRHILSVSILIVLMVVSVSFIFPKKSYAQMEFIGFGGRTVQDVTPCAGGKLVYVAGLPLPLFLPTGFPVLGYAPIVPLVPVNSLGLFVPVGVCVVPPGVSIPVLGTITLLFGISLPIPF